MSVDTCHLCRADALVSVDRYREFSRITSDVRFFPAGGQLAVCQACGGIQKPETAAWRRECQAIYASYIVYRQGSGQEQAIFFSTGAGEARSRWLLRRLAEHLDPHRPGCHLDFGCGDGSLLRNAMEFLPGWKKSGSEISESRRPDIESIPGISNFYSCDPSYIKEKFELITSVHVFEHFSRPLDSLKILQSLLSDDGIIFLQVPDIETNPFDLLIADHATHFSLGHLHRILEGAGLSVQLGSNSWIRRELSVLAAATGPAMAGPPAMDFTAAAALVERHLGWLGRLRSLVREVGATGPFAIFGTSIAATWVAIHAPKTLAWFVDEDAQRVGVNYLGRPVMLPTDLAPGTRVLMAHTPEFAWGMKARLEETAPHVELIMPPDW